MARLIVQFPLEAKVKINGMARGDTNRVIRLEPGNYLVELEGEATEPASRNVTVKADSSHDEIMFVGFKPAERPIERFSPLYCRYNGFLLGQFLSLSFAKYGRELYPVRRARMLEFLQEVAVDVPLPEEAPELGSDAHVRLIEEVLPKLTERSNELTDFVLLGTLLTHHGLLAKADPGTARDCLDQLGWIREKYQLPTIDPDRFILEGDGQSVEDVLSPSLAYLAEVVDGLEEEKDTAFVIMPFKPPYDSYFATFYRPSLEQAGFRAFRAWGGLSSEDYCDLLLKLIAKTGMVWADVSELNYNVLYEIGAAHALGKLSMLVVAEDYASSVPANIGHDTIVKYSPAVEDWPQGTVLLMATLISSLKLAAEQGRCLRIGPDALGGVLNSAGTLLEETVVPPEAHEAARSGRQKFADGDYPGAERCFDDAIRLGLDDSVTMLGRGSARLWLKDYSAAEADLTLVLAAHDEDTAAARQQRGLAAFFRGIAREQLRNYAGAREDYGTALALGYPEVDVYRRRAFVEIQLEELKQARGDAEKTKELAPEDSQTCALGGDLLLAEGQYEEAIGQYDKALAVQGSTDVEFARALALLLAGRVANALDSYRRGMERASEDEVDWALLELVKRALGRLGFDECRSVLVVGRGRDQKGGNHSTGV